MNFLISSLSLFLVAAVLSTAIRGEKAKIFFACFGVIAASLLGLVPTVNVLLGNGPIEGMWQGEIPGLILALGIDPLSAFFLAAIFFLSILVAVYSIGYAKDQPRFATYSPFFPVLIGAMAAVVVARDGFLFLICWEVMSLSSFFLVSVEHQAKEVRYAGWIYLIATHLATTFLAVFFILFHNRAGTFLFADFAQLHLPASLAGLLFVFSVIGFGTKAGLFPFHVWLPHAHPAAPSPVSALMSGVMIETGIYGILRTLTFLGMPKPWWGALLMLMGSLSAVLGILYAFLQDDIKKFLAYSSVENIGIITMAMGLGVMGTALSNPLIAGLGFAGALFHFLNHTLFKGLLFLSAGGVVHSAHTRQINRLGGLLKRMPVTGMAFLVASLGALSFPIFNGFAGEWLIFTGLFRGTQILDHFPLFLSVVGIVAMAFAGGLALAAFSKMFGVVFLGQARSKEAEECHESSRWMLFPLFILAFCCLAIGLYPQGIFKGIVPVVQSLAFSPQLASVMDAIPWNKINLVVSGLVGFFLLLLGIRHVWLAKKTTALVPTWGCGYPSPTARMQYSGPSFSEPVSSAFKSILKPQIHFKEPAGFFPATTRYMENVDDLAEKRIFFPVFEKGSRFLSFLKQFQKNRTQDYLAMMFFTLIVLLLWEVWFGI